MTILQKHEKLVQTLQTGLVSIIIIVYMHAALSLILSVYKETRLREVSEGTLMQI